MDLSPETLAAQALGAADPWSGGLAPVINPATSYERQPDGSYRESRVYTRADNPTYEPAERLLAALEGAGCACAVFASGMAAATAVFQSLLPGDHVLVSRVLYWGVRKWLAEFALTWGLDVEFTDTTDLGAVASAIRPGQTRLLWVETPANPMWEITDLAAACELAHASGVRVAVDNTVATPVLTRPFEHGADLVVHSATKYLNGHSDVLAGAVLTARRDPFWERIRSWRRNAGAVPGPFEAWLLQRGMRTLFLRVHRASGSALAIAEHFHGHPALVLAVRMGLPHNPVQAVIAAADKATQRHLWAAARVAQPEFRVVPATATADNLRQAAAEIGFPCVVKATSLSASQGVLRAGDPAAAVAAARRIRQVLAAAGRPGDEPLLVEEYVPGPELSIDGLLTAGILTVTAVFDKPGTPEGPTFEETLLVTPSRLPGPVLAAAISTAGQAARALGLIHGPIHAELRIDERGRQARPVMLELAARCIGGLCSRALDFGGRSLEELVLANALGRPVPPHRGSRPSGVLMLPVPRSGVLRAVEGRHEAAATPGITGLTITAPIGQHVRPLPDPGPYLGFIFAACDTHGQVEQALAAARERLRVVID
jgi:cystathionine gamma-synthase